jgi:hypothetical protein
MKISTLPQVVAVTVPPGEFRTPRVVVALRCGVVMLRVMVRRLSGSRLDVSAPTAADGAAGVEMPADLWADVERAALAAVSGDADAVEALLAGRRTRGRGRHAAREQPNDFDGDP